MKRQLGLWQTEKQKILKAYKQLVRDWHVDDRKKYSKKSIYANMIQILYEDNETLFVKR